MVKNTEIAKHDPNTHVYSWCGQELTLTPDIVRKYLVSGGGKVSDQEIMMFIGLCKFQQLNPFLKEAYLIKYGSDAPAAMVTAKEVFLKRACRNDLYEGHTVGINKEGTVAWCEVYKTGYKVPIRVEVDYDEYVGKKRDGTPNKSWLRRRMMLKKCALVGGLREAFPEELHGLYSKEEMDSVTNEQRRTFKPEVDMPKSIEEKNSIADHTCSGEPPDLDVPDQQPNPPKSTKKKDIDNELYAYAKDWEEKLGPVVLKTKILKNPIFKKKTDLLSFNREELESFINLCTEYEKENK